MKKINLLFRIKVLNKTLLIGISTFMLAYTGCMRNREPTEPTPIARPKANATSPASGTLKIPLDTKITVSFTEAMDINTFANHFYVEDYTGKKVDGTLSSVDTNIVFTSLQPLEGSTLYRVILKGRVRDIYENSIEYNSRAILDDTTTIISNWFYTVGKYSENGYYHIFVRDRQKGSIYTYSYLDSLASTVGQFNAPLGMNVSSDGSYLIVSNTGNNEIDLVSTSSGQTDQKISVPQNPSTIVVSGDYAYVVSDYGKAITKINIPSKAIDKELNLNFYPGKLAVSGDGKILYTLDQVTRDLVLVDASTGNEIKRVSNGFQKIVQGEIRYEGGSDQLYICDAKGNQVLKADKNGNSIITAITFPTGIEPSDIQFDDSFVYVSAGSSIYKYDKQSFVAVDTLSFAENVKSLTIIPTKDLLYAVSINSVIVVDLNSFHVLRNIGLTSTGIEGIVCSPIKF